MMLREKRDINPLLIKFGVVLALSFAGFLYSRFRTKRKPSLPPPSPHPSDHGSEVDSGGRAPRRDDLHVMKTSPNSCNTVSIAAERYEEPYMQKVTLDNSMAGLSPSSRHGEKEGFLFPEFNDLMKEFDLAATNAGFSPKKEVETPTSDVETHKAFRSAEMDDYEREIIHLRNMVLMLRERERNLEVQLLEYYGLKEQETAVMELQNRLKINNMEAKLFTLKIESLQADNRRLEAQLADHAKIVSELEVARTKIKLLKKKLRIEAEQNREQILALQKRVSKLQEQEYKAAANDPEIQLKLQRLEDLEGEVEGLRKSSLRLQIENSDLARRLESTQILANSVLEDPETEELKEVSDQLRQENENLGKEIERLQVDRCADVEELVYLRWINACLRYELRNYQPPPGKTVARDLSKTLSPKSEEKAKQLILEYGNTEGVGEKAINIMDFDSDRWSSSQASYITEDFEDSSLDNSSAPKTHTSSKYKFFSKLRRLVRGKDNHHHDQVSSSEKVVSLEDYDSPQYSSSISTGLDAISEVHSNRVTTPTQNSFRSSLDIQRLRSLRSDDSKDLGSVQRNSDVGSYKRLVLGREVSSDLSVENQLDQDSDPVGKSELVKFAEALKHSRVGSVKLHKKSASFSFG